MTVDYDDFEEDAAAKPLRIHCTDTDCPNGRHYFRPKPRGEFRPPRGPCRSCGDDGVDWERVNRRDISDFAYTYEALNSELIRHHFWTVPFDKRALNHARRKGKQQLLADAGHIVRSKVGAAATGWDGRQTPRGGNVLHYAQHATAVCCRKCIDEWHDIPQGRELANDEVEYLSNLIGRYVDIRLSDLPNEGQYVPQIRRK